MEVDSTHSVPQQGVGSRHVSPFSNLSAVSSHSSIHHPNYVGMNKKRRRRSSRLLNLSPSPSQDADFARGTFLSEEESAEDDEGVLTRLAKRKRDNHQLIRGGTDISHQFRALGSAIASSNESDYGVDSPMYSLSLASPSPPNLSPERKFEDDVDMGEDNKYDGDYHSSSSSRPSLPLIPRQVKSNQYQRLNSTAPIRPSPLIQSERFMSSSTPGSQSSSQNVYSSQSVISTDCEMSKRHQPQHDYNYDTSSPRRQSSHLVRKALAQSSSRDFESLESHDTILTHEFNRTPSPSPIILSSEPATNENRKLHHSPGLSQASFPGGKQLLRYTMGYREDCSACKSRTPGHYGHVMHH